MVRNRLDNKSVITRFGADLGRSNPSKPQDSPPVARTIQSLYPRSRSDLRHHQHLLIFPLDNIQEGFLANATMQKFTARLAFIILVLILFISLIFVTRHENNLRRGSVIRHVVVSSPSPSALEFSDGDNSFPDEKPPEIGLPRAPTFDMAYRRAERKRVRGLIR